jgi:predicted nucleotidyltransferase component of viral defense system
MLVTTWLKNPHRPTRDIDFLGFGNPQPESILAAFKNVCAIEADDGASFDIDALTIERNREDLVYGGLRVATNAHIGGARVRVVIDIGFGDAIEPGLQEIELPVLLDQPAPKLRAYAMETVIAEKFQAMVALGRVNSRMKDFYDIWYLSKTFTFEDDRLARAIAATFKRRQTEVPVDVPDALTDAFAEDDQKQKQWEAFVSGVLADPVALNVVVSDLRAFLIPHAQAARSRTDAQQ